MGSIGLQSGPLVPVQDRLLLLQKLLFCQYATFLEVSEFREFSVEVWLADSLNLSHLLINATPQCCAVFSWDHQT